MQWKCGMNLTRMLQILVSDQKAVKLHVVCEVQVHIDVVKVGGLQVVKLLAIAAVVEDEVLETDVVRPPLHCI